MIELGPKSLTQNRYELKCKVLIRERSYQDEQSQGVTQVTEKMAYLIPCESSERDRFLSAWLPDTDEEHFEVGLLIGHPVHGPARATVHRKSREVPEHHLFIMSRGVEEELKKFSESGWKALRAIQKKTVHLTVLSENEELIIDQAQDFALAANKNK
jgi:hypothetical protein